MSQPGAPRTGHTGVVVPSVEVRGQPPTACSLVVRSCEENCLIICGKHPWRGIFVCKKKESKSQALLQGLCAIQPWHVDQTLAFSLPLPWQVSLPEHNADAKLLRRVSAQVWRWKLISDVQAYRLSYRLRSWLRLAQALHANRCQRSWTLRKPMRASGISWKPVSFGLLGRRSSLLSLSKRFRPVGSCFPLSDWKYQWQQSPRNGKWTFYGRWYFDQRPLSVSTLLILRDRKKRSTAAGRNGLSPGSQHLRMHDVHAWCAAGCC